MNIFSINNIICFILIIFICLPKTIILNFDEFVIIRIVSILIIVFSCFYSIQISLLLSIIYIISISNNIKTKYNTNTHDIYESFSIKENGVHDLNKVLTFLKQPHSPQVLETMFTQKKKTL
jgi:hypothetical protein